MDDEGARTAWRGVKWRYSGSYDMTLNRVRVEALLDAIDKFRGLPEAQREELRPLLNETLDRFNALSRYSAILRGYLARRNAESAQPFESRHFD
jgi:hypothetical protein